MHGLLPSERSARVVSKGAVGHLLNGGGKVLQGFSSELVPCFQPNAVRCVQVVVAIANLKCLDSLFVCLSCMDAV